jgi:hypothetical protein
MFVEGVKMLAGFSEVNLASAVSCRLQLCTALGAQLALACVWEKRVKLASWILPSSGLFTRRAIGSSETSVSNHFAPHNNPEDGRIQLNRGGSQRSRIAFWTPHERKVSSRPFSATSPMKHISVWGLRCSDRRCWIRTSSGMLRRVDW